MNTYSKLLLAFLLLVICTACSPVPPENGPYVKYWPSGGILSWQHYKNGKLDGLRTVWHENGQKWREEHYKNGVNVGRETHWYQHNGQKSAEWHYKNGKMDGLATWWHENGQKRQEIHYKNGEGVSGQKF